MYELLRVARRDNFWAGPHMPRETRLEYVVDTWTSELHETYVSLLTNKYDRPYFDANDYNAWPDFRNWHCALASRMQLGIWFPKHLFRQYNEICLYHITVSNCVFGISQAVFRKEDLIRYEACEVY